MNWARARMSAERIYGDQHYWHSYSEYCDVIIQLWPLLTDFRSIIYKISDDVTST